MSDRPLFRNRYRIRGKLGSGAFATVYLAHDTRMDRPVAIKVVDDAGEPDGRAFREAQAAAKLNHPHIVTVHEVVREEGRTLSLIHISEPTRRTPISYAVFCLKKKKKINKYYSTR